MEEPIRGKRHVICKDLKAERAYYLGKITGAVVSMAVSKAIHGTAEEEEVAVESQVTKDLVQTAR